MNKNQIQAIADWFFLRTFDDAVVNVADFMLEAIDDSLEINRILAEDYAYSGSEDIWNALITRISEQRKRNLYPTFSVVPNSQRRLYWNPMYFPPNLTKKDMHRRLRIRSRARILREIKDFDFRSYEALSLFAFKISGATNFCLTKKGNDFGLDFLAVIPSIGRSHLVSGVAGPIRIVGQCKKQTRPVQRNTVESFITTLNSIHQRSTKLKKLIPNWFYGQRGPIVGWVISDSGLQSGAKELSNDFGILFSDSRDIAETITMSRSWTTTEGLNAPVELMMRETKQILDNHVYG